MHRTARVRRDVRIRFPWNLTIGERSTLGDGVTIWNLGPVSIGSDVVISQRAHLCAGTHDFRDPRMPLRTPPISVGDRAWVCAEAFIGPGVSVGAGAVVGARAVVVRDVPHGAVVAGNPAKVVGRR